MKMASSILVRPRPARPVAALLAIGLSAAPALGDEGGGGLYFGDLGQAVAAVLIFGALLLILGRYAWKPILAQLKHREEVIAATIHSAEKREKQAEALNVEYEQRLAGAEEEAGAILSEARADAARQREKVLADAREEARQYAESAKAELEKAREQALAELRAVAAEVATDAAGRIIRRSLDPEDHRRLVQESLDEIRRRAAERS